MKKIFMSIIFICLLPILFVGCVKKEELPIVKEYMDSSTLVLSVQYDKEKASKETLLKELENLVERSEIVEKKSVLVKFYEYENEDDFSDIRPYAYGFWGSDKGMKKGVSANPKSNKYFIEMNTEMDKNITDEDIVAYKEMLEKFKHDEIDATKSLGMLLLLEYEPSELSEVTAIYTKFQERFVNDGYTKIVEGKFS